jgi:hypothetical protein
MFRIRRVVWHTVAACPPIAAAFPGYWDIFVKSAQHKMRQALSATAKDIIAGAAFR